MNQVEFSREDVEAHRVWAALGYLLFFIPLIKNRKSELCRFCANEGLILLIVEVIISILFSIFAGIPLIGWLFKLVGRLLRLGVSLFGLLLTVELMANDKAFELPFIGHIRLIR